VLDYTDRVAVVTGAGTGLGREYALLLAARGASVVVNNPIRAGVPASKATAVVAEIEAAGGRAVADTHSVVTVEGGIAIIDTALAEFGRLDILVNNAGIRRDRAFANMTPADVEDVLDVHLRGTFHTTLPAYRQMKIQGYGRLVSTSSAAGLFGNFGQANYGAAKMAIVGLTKVLAIEGAKYGIKANVVAPMATTAMSSGLLDVEWEQRLRPSLVAPAVAFLAHEKCPSSGEVFTVAGGRVARVFIAETRGYFDADLTIEDVEANWARICAEGGYEVPASARADRLLLSGCYDSL
jgi:NAD(P)-dependent dehydrogenase (short-subunit alcohol dehydrogenase family)